MATPNAQTRPERDRNRPLAPEATPKRGHEHDQLSVFAGGWRAEGASWGPKSDGELQMVAEEVWEWMPGGFFLTCRFDTRTAEGRHRGRGYLSYDEGRKSHVCRMIDDLGYDRLYLLSANGRAWHFRGERERATYSFTEDGRGIDIRWEQSADGVDWRPLCELKAVRTAGLPTAH